MAKTDSKKPKQTKNTAKQSNKASTPEAKQASTKKVSAEKTDTAPATASKRKGIKKILRSPFRGYFVGAWRELKEVTWPDRKTTWKFTLIVIMFSVIFSAFTAGLDVGFEKLAKQIFLK